MVSIMLSKPATGRAHSVGTALAVLLLTASLAACSSKPRLGDTIRSQGVELAAIGDRWSEGDDLVDNGREQIEDGQDMVAKGNKMIAKGEKLLEKGRDNVTRGQQMKQQAESTYRTRTGQELPVE